MKELVLDVSHLDVGIDLAAWKSKHDVWGVIIKCGGYEDIGNGPEQFRLPSYDRHYANAKSLGLHVGAYFYSIATDVNQARRDAEYCASILAGRDFDMPIYLDVEDRRQLGKSKRVLTDTILTFILRMRELGYNAGLYTYRSMLEENMYGKEFEPYPLWIAEYSSACHTDLNHGMWQFGGMRYSDGDISWHDDSGYVDANWCYVDYPSQKRGAKLKHIDIANEAAEIHHFMCIDPRFGYNQQPERWGGDHSAGTIEFTSSSGRKYKLKTGSYDCSSSTITAYRLALQYTKYAHALDDATYTGDMRDVFVGSGLFTASLTPARRGDLYLAEGKHVAMCQDGGSDGVFNADILSEFNRNENHAASWGEAGDQDGYESVVRDYYDDGWNTVLHYNHAADYDIKEDDMPTPKQVAGKAKNNYGLKYQAHVQDIGWCPVVHDGQTAGTVGFGKRLEAIRFTEIPAGVEGNVKLHIANVGWRTYKLAKGTIIGTTGKGNAIECIILNITKHPDKKSAYIQVHQANVGWKGVTKESYASGTDGMGMQLEAIRIWFE